MSTGRTRRRGSNRRSRTGSTLGRSRQESGFEQFGRRQRSGAIRSRGASQAQQRDGGRSVSPRGPRSIPDQSGHSGFARALQAAVSRVDTPAEFKRNVHDPLWRPEEPWGSRASIDSHLPVDPQALSRMGMGQKPGWAVQQAPVAVPNPSPLDRLGRIPLNAGDISEARARMYGATGEEGMTPGALRMAGRQIGETLSAPIWGSMAQFGKYIMPTGPQYIPQESYDPAEAYRQGMEKARTATHAAQVGAIPVPVQQPNVAVQEVNQRGYQPDRSGYVQPGLPGGSRAPGTFIPSGYAGQYGSPVNPSGGHQAPWGQAPSSPMQGRAQQSYMNQGHPVQGIPGYQAPGPVQGQGGLPVSQAAQRGFTPDRSGYVQPGLPQGSRVNYGSPSQPWSGQPSFGQFAQSPQPMQPPPGSQVPNYPGAYGNIGAPNQVGWTGQPTQVALPRSSPGFNLGPGQQGLNIGTAQGYSGPVAHTGTPSAPSAPGPVENPLPEIQSILQRAQSPGPQAPHGGGALPGVQGPGLTEQDRVQLLASLRGYFSQNPPGASPSPSPESPSQGQGTPGGQGAGLGSPTQPGVQGQGGPSQGQGQGDLAGPSIPDLQGAPPEIQQAIQLLSQGFSNEQLADLWSRLLAPRPQGTREIEVRLPQQQVNIQPVPFLGESVFGRRRRKGVYRSA